jgi:alpha-tubulin suppressor-like RCC1 family protein
MKILRRHIFAPFALLLALVASAAAQETTRTRLRVSPTPTGLGQLATLTAEVDNISSSGGPAPTGIVGFDDGAKRIGQGTLVAEGAGQATLAMGAAHSCALNSIGNVDCWGYLNDGRLGDGINISGYTGRPVHVVGLSDAVAVASGAAHSCALTIFGGVRCWGLNRNGQIGDGTTATRYRPMDVVGLSSGVVAIAVGDYHSCALTSSGAVKCWGLNSAGQLGDGTIVDRLTPTPVAGLTSEVAAIAAGARHNCALTSASGLRCWGLNNAGQIGDGSTVNRTTPVSVSGLTAGVVAMAGGGAHSCAVTSAGAVKCWGANGSGQIGDGSRVGRSTPAALSDLSSGVVAVVAGAAYSCALTADGIVRCWGANASGQLGDGTNVTRRKPVAVAGLVGVVAIGAGGSHACAATFRGALSCWGRNGTAQLGDGTNTDRSAPVYVPGQILQTRARARFATTGLALGAHQLGAVYPGNVRHRPSSGTAIHNVQ